MPQSVDGIRFITVDISDIKVSDDQNSVLITYALGSCIAVILWDPTRKVGGMIHYMLPLSSTSREKAKTTPAMFADTGVPLLFRTMYKYVLQNQDTRGIGALIIRCPDRFTCWRRWAVRRLFLHLFSTMTHVE